MNTIHGKAVLLFYFNFFLFLCETSSGKWLSFLVVWLLLWFRAVERIEENLLRFVINQLFPLNQWFFSIWTSSFLLSFTLIWSIRMSFRFVILVLHLSWHLFEYIAVLSIKYRFVFILWRHLDWFTHFSFSLDSFWIFLTSFCKGVFTLGERWMEGDFSWCYIQVIFVVHV